MLPGLLGIEWMDLGWWLESSGSVFFWVCLVILFVECGLLFPFLPGDTLLFGVGLFVATGRLDLIPGAVWVDLTVALVLMTTAAFVGNVVGYEIGRRVGPPLYRRDGRLPSRRHFDRTHAFFRRHGPLALVAGRYVAFVRTYITVVAGAIEMERRRFLLWSLVGAASWVLSLGLLGYFLGASAPWLQENLELAMLAILTVFAVPLVYEAWLARHRDRETEEGSLAAELRERPQRGSDGW
ncbi:VTT domain-containing protein [Nocardioides coralli]|nr:VTT domain-containing protein [Nocardioides coralli]